MVRFRLGIAAIFLCALGAPALAQSPPAPAHAPHKAHAKKASAPSDYSEDWDIAAPSSRGAAAPADVTKDPNLTEGRKKFFDQSTTMENGGPGESHKASGFNPGMGFNF